jgi:FAD/FMN-containing dehydrogenase
MSGRREAFGPPTTTIREGILMLDTTTTSLVQLQEDLNGRVIWPDDPDYDAARTVFYRSRLRRPAAVVRPADAGEVSRVVSLARETGLELAVRSGGHSLAGHSATEGGIVLDLSSMRGLEIDAESRTAWAQTGLTAAEYTKAADAHGLATGFGDTGSVGIGGLTLGGGIGYLVRKHGLTVDDLLAAEVVTADGELLTTDAETHPDLFWAIRGGGGNFGVATRFHFRLHPIDTIVGGMLVLPATPEVIAGFVAEAQAAPEELSTIANVMVAPPMPFLPEAAHGKLVVLGLVCFAGDAEAGMRALAPFRALAAPLADFVRPMRYPEIYELFGEEGPGPEQEVARSFFRDEVDAEAAATVVEQLQASTAPMAVAQLRVLGGAMDRVPHDATAFPHRGRGLMVALGAIYERAEESPEHEAWVTRFTDAFRADGDAWVYVNFLGDEGAERVRDAYPGATWDRLAEVKRRYDPANVFRLNQNVPPAA